MYALCLEHLNIEPGNAVLDIGSGTGHLTAVRQIYRFYCDMLPPCSLFSCLFIYFCFALDCCIFGWTGTYETIVCYMVMSKNLIFLFFLKDGVFTWI